MNVKLVVVQGKPAGKEIAIRSTKFLIGRGAECHLRPNSELVSRHHCLFTLDDAELRLRDLGSTNGTVVNGSRIDGEVVVSNRDLVQVGSLGFQVVIESVPVAVGTTPELPAAQETAPMPVPAAAPVAGKLGSKDASESDIHLYLLSDANNPVPDSGSGVYTGDTQMFEKTTVERAAAQDTKTDFVPPPIDAEPPQESVETSEQGEKVVATEGGGKIKIAAAKQKIDKTREDTSRAAADIIKRMLERRPGK